MDLQQLWFLLIAVFWAGYFLLEGFDFGVGMLLPFLPRGEEDRKTMLETIGPVWDGNEVWLVVAGAATFAAFPTWYATMFSGLYIALLLVLVFLIVRVVSFEWRGKSESTRWRSLWAWANTIGSTGAALVWGIGLANLVYGVPLDSNGDFAGSFSDLFSPYTVFAGLSVVLLFAFHGATFMTLRTTGELHERAGAAARRLSLPAAAVAAAFLIWTVVVAVDHNDKNVFPPLLPALLGIVACPRSGIRLPRAGRVVVRRHCRRDGRCGGHVVHEPLPPRDGVEPELREQPDDRRRLVLALRAGRDDGRRAGLHPDCPPLPRVDLLRLPATRGRPAALEPAGRLRRATRSRARSLMPRLV